MGGEPLVSIVIPCFNRERLIADALRSCLSQTWKAWECLVVDDGSTDGTVDVVAGFAGKDDRIRLLRRTRSPKGAATCRNLGLDDARGRYVVFLDSDDLLAPYCLEERVQGMEGRDLAFLVFPMLYFHRRPLDSEELVAREGAGDHLTRFLHYDFPWHTTGPIWRRDELLRTLGGFDEAALGGGQDWELHVRALVSGMAYAVMDDALPDAFFRSHGGERISRAASREVVEARRRLYENTLDFILQRTDLTADQRRGFLGVYLQLVSEPLLEMDRDDALRFLRDFAMRLEIQEPVIRRAERFLEMPWESQPIPFVKRVVRRGALGVLLPERAPRQRLPEGEMRRIREQVEALGWGGVDWDEGEGAGGAGTMAKGPSDE